MEITSFISDFENLPRKIQEQVLDYVEFLMTKYKKRGKKDKIFKFDWEDGLSELKKDYTSVELQHQANELR
jgi:hypothetical protein